MRGLRGYNICPWLKNGKREICGKSCREDYCKDHRKIMRNGGRIPRPCLRCGIGVRSQIELCRGCGREKERQKIKRLERLAPLLQIWTQLENWSNNLLQQWVKFIRKRISIFFCQIYHLKSFIIVWGRTMFFSEIFSTRPLIFRRKKLLRSNDNRQVHGVWETMWRYVLR